MHMTMAIIKGLNSIRYLDSSLTRADLGKSLNFKMISKRSSIFVQNNPCKILNLHFSPLMLNPEPILFISADNIL